MLDNKIKIAILEVNDQNKAILEFYFNNAGKVLYTEVSKAEADVFITDYDYPGAKEHWEEVSKTSNKPGLILSISEKDIPSTIWLAKPLSSKALIDASAKIREMINNEVLVETTPIIETLVSEEVIELNELNDISEEVFTEQINPQKIAQVSVKKHEKINEDELESGLAMIDTGALSSTTLDDMDVDESLNTDIENSSEISQVNTDAGALSSTILDDMDVDESLNADIENSSEISQINIDTNAQGLSSLDASVTNETTQELADYTEDEYIDILLESLILTEGEKKNPIIDDIDNNRETPTDSLSLTEEKPETVIEIYEEVTVAETLSGTDEVTEVLTGSSLPIEDPVSVAESLPAKDQPLSIKNSVVKDFLLHDDLSPSMENTFADTLKVNPEDDSSLETPDDKKLINSKLDKLLSEVALPPVVDSIQEEKIEPDLDPDVQLDHKKSTEQELQSLLDEVRQEADKNINKTASSNFKDSDNISNFDRKKTKARKQTNAERRWALLCGENKNIEKPQDVKYISFTLNKHLLGVVLDQIDQAKSGKQVYRLKHDDFTIVIDHSMNNIYCNYSLQSKEYADFCFNTLNPDNIKIHELDYSEIRLYRKKMDDLNDKSHSIEAFIWTTSLLTSQGRLLENTDITKKIGLKVWPNLTQLELIPHAINIAAVFSKHPGSLQEIPNWLGIPQRYVFAFYNAALSLDMIELDSNKIKISAFSFNTNGSKKKSEERSFFGRLLKRLTA